MNESLLLEHLEEIAGRLGVELRYENLGQSGFNCGGGFCRLNGRSIILLNRRDSRQKKINVLLQSLKKLDLEGIFIPPAVRNAIETRNN